MKWRLDDGLGGIVSHNLYIALTEMFDVSRTGVLLNGYSRVSLFVICTFHMYVPHKLRNLSKRREFHLEA